VKWYRAMALKDQLSFIFDSEILALIYLLKKPLVISKYGSSSKYSIPLYSRKKELVKVSCLIFVCIRIFSLKI